LDARLAAVPAWRAGELEMTRASLLHIFVPPSLSRCIAVWLAGVAVAAQVDGGAGDAVECCFMFAVVTSFRSRKSFGAEVFEENSN